MSWQERKKEYEQKKAAEAARQAKEKTLKELSIHPLLKEKCSRDFCDAYFLGLVFAAFADNEKIDKGERKVLDAIATSLGMSTYDVDEAVNAVQAVVDDADKFGALIDECVSVIKASESAVRLFYAQVVQVWFSSADDGGGSPDNDLADMAKTADVALPPAKLSLIKKVLKGGDGFEANLLSLSEWMGEDALKYFVVKQHGDVTDVLAKARKRKKAEADKLRRNKALAVVRKKAKQQLDAAVKDAVRVYGGRASISIGALEDISERVDGIDGDLIDWPAEVEAILNSSSKCRKRVWRLVVLLMLDYKPVYSDMCDELDWLLDAKSVLRADWEDWLEEFIDTRLKDRL